MVLILLFSLILFRFEGSLPLLIEAAETTRFWGCGRIGNLLVFPAFLGNKLVQIWRGGKMRRRMVYALVETLRSKIYQLLRVSRILMINNSRDRIGLLLVRSLLNVRVVLLGNVGHGWEVGDEFCMFWWGRMLWSIIWWIVIHPLFLLWLIIY